MKSSVPSASSSRRPFGVESTGLPAIVTSARIWPSPGVSISSASADDRQLAAELGQPAHPALPRAPDAGRVPGPGSAVDGRPREHRAARPVEVAGDGVEHLDQPLADRAELLRRHAHAAVARRPGRRVANSRAIRADRVRGDPGAAPPRARASTARRAALERLQPVDVRRRRAACPSASTCMDQREQERRVGARAG